MEDCIIQPDILGSDHCPVQMTFKDDYQALAKSTLGYTFPVQTSMNMNLKMIL